MSLYGVQECFDQGGSVALPQHCTVLSRLRMPHVKKSSAVTEM